MSRADAYFGSRCVPQLAVLALISFGVAGCSADMSSRLSNPFNYQPESTGSVPAAAPQAQVERRELPQYSRPPYQASAAPPAVAAPQSYPVAHGGVSGGGRGMASYTPPVAYAPPAKPKLETTASVPPRSVAAARPAPGMTIIVGTSDTLEVLAKRYHVTPAAILAANGYKGPRRLSPGQSLIIPRPTVAAAAPVPAAVASQRVAAVPVGRPAAVAAAPSIHVVNPGETLASIAHHNHISVAELARANNIDAAAKLKLGARLTVPAKTAAAPAAPLGAVATAPAAVPVAGTRVAAAAPQQSARLAQANPPPEEAVTPLKASEATGALPTFRWPVRGKIIAAYGAKTNGKSNDGINLAVPEGTPVKAAEDGVVAYAGNELKGYGNLILVRHANGYVTAYAHASQLLVKRGDTIKRGQVIAKSGQSGEVASPQLHFEIRKGSTPVDPLQFLSGA
ncbi:MAG TPA: LysM peptidoglycan-binding domain-containing M23 family metallopeptidase [Bradyrhizobium sp.]|uniref:LysM peptidoglycan-binding domain-containing M23 family metallopeptidase n=1 Tax=Bradyrhizobium sp. TaxID=376 RepID=UPI002C21A9FC|nr:LysM peptidoglycan-binding domain-containing M23 family metallopeptidase [Bradyrhizobium sp.]HLZ02262.1 LysM peptidoglycan-binding domain-containing M23 family metallopeptidase [Bradyrhizobium sp.]